jgi:hypothetical protein
MGAMLKISIVMLTTAVFAGLLIADPYGPSMMSAARRTAIVAANLQAAPGTPQAQREPSSSANPVVQRDNPAAKEATHVAVAANDEPNAPAVAFTPTRPQLGRATQERSEKRDRVRAMPDRYIHTASLTNVARHVRRHV